MKSILSLSLVGAMALVLTGCGKSDSTTTPSTSGTQPAPPQNSVPAAPLVPATPIAPKEAATPTTAEQLQKTGANLAAQLASAAKASADQVLSDIGKDLGGAAMNLASSLADNPAVKSQVEAALQTLVKGDSLQAMSQLPKLAELKLTEGQTKLFGQTRDLVAAYVTQKDLSKLEGLQGEVGQIVKSLRQGEPMSAVPAIQKLTQQAQLTPGQKDLISALAAQYAPGLKKAGDQVQQGLDAANKLRGTFGK